jgi:hypothetical protein
MNEVRRVIRLASWRLWFLDVLRTLAVTITAALILVMLARITEQVLGIRERFEPLWRNIFIGAGAGALLLSLLWSAIRRRRALSVACELDERAGLKESLSTALCVHSNPDPWAQVMVETAELKAKAVNVSRAIPLHAPSFWPVPLSTALAFLLVWLFVPNFDLLGATKKQVAQQEHQQQVIQAKADVQDKQQKLKELLAKTKVDFAEEPTDTSAENKKPDINDPDSIRRAAVKALTDLTAKIETAKAGEKAAQAEAIKEAMKQLKQPGPGPLDEFSRSLARGDFNKAKDQLAEVSKAMADGSMSPEQRDQAKQQMEGLAKQVENLAQSQDQLQKKLENNGLDKKTAQELAKQAASDPEAVKKALDQLKNLTDDQKKQLLEMAKAASKSQSQCKNMGDAMSKMAKGMSQPGLQQEGAEGAGDLAKELSDAEMLQSDMQNLDAALKEAKKQMAQLGECLGGDGSNGNGEGSEKNGQGPWRAGNADRKGSGSGGPGQSSGGASPAAQPTDFTSEKHKAPGKTGQGPIIGSRLVYGQQVKGESTAEFQAGVDAGAQEAAEAMDNMQIPREYHDAVKHYFGTLGDKVKKDKPAPPAPAATDAKPAAPAPADKK